MPEDESDSKEALSKYATAFAAVLPYQFNPLAAFFGGIVAQECVKAITKKFVPIKQTFYLDAIELM